MFVLPLSVNEEDKDSMKKLMVLLCAGMLLAGCGSKKEEAKTDENRESKVCTIEQAGIKWN